MNAKVTDLKKKIKKKFKNTSRFSLLSQLPYHYIQNGFKKQNELTLRRIEEAIDGTENAPITDEVTPELIENVKLQLPKKKEDRAEWCRQNGVNLWWLKQFLSGEVRFKNQFRVKRLLDLLGIE